MSLVLRVKGDLLPFLCPVGVHLSALTEEGGRVSALYQISGLQRALVAFSDREVRIEGWEVSGPGGLPSPNQVLEVITQSREPQSISVPLY